MPVLFPAGYGLTPSYVLSWLGEENSLVRGPLSISAQVH